MLRLGALRSIFCVMSSPFYIHSWDPVLLPIHGALAIRWYGLAYVAGFIFAFLMLRRWSRQRTFPVQEEDLSSLIYYIVLGVMFGGRMGYMILYDFSSWRVDPLLMFKVWHGGMSSHGGMIGMTTAIYFFARSRRLPFLGIMDHLVCVAPAGLLFGRLANYINGELWGRITQVPWAVVFPQEAGLYPPRPGLHEDALALLQSGVLHPRHPSQLYEAFLEGLLLLGVMLWVRRTAWARAPGRLSALFLIVYGLGRFTVEFFREPEIVHGWMTQGQLLSLFLFVPAVWLLVRANRRNELTASRKKHG